MRPNSVGQRLRVLRIAKGIKQSDLAVGICSQSMLSMIEHDKTIPSLPLLTHLCERLDVPVAEVIDLYSEATHRSLERRIEVAYSYLHTNQYATALLVAESLLSSNPRLEHRYQFECAFIQGMALYRLGQFHQAWAKIRECKRLAETNQHKQRLVQSLNSLAVTLMRDNQWTKAVVLLRRAMGLSSELKVSEALRIRVSYNLAKTLRMLGRWQESNILIDETLEIIRRCYVMQAFGHLHTLHGLNDLDLGQLDEAYAHFLKARQFYDIIEDRVSFVGASLNLARWSIRVRDFSAAHRVLDEVAALLQLMAPAAVKGEYEELLAELVKAETHNETGRSGV